MIDILYLENTLYYLETLLKLILKAENAIQKSQIKKWNKLIPIFEKNKIVQEDTWQKAYEKIVHCIQFINENNLNYEYNNKFLEQEIVPKIDIYKSLLLHLNKSPRIFETDEIKIFISSMLIDLVRVLNDIFQISISIECYSYTVLDSNLREIKVNQVLDSLQAKLNYKGKIRDLLYTNYLKKRRRKLDKIFKRSDSFSLKSISAEYTLLTEIIRATKQLQGLRKSIKDGEKNRTMILANLINKFIAKDESGYGISETGQNAGEIDIKIEDEYGDVISICEAFNLKHYFNKQTISKHLAKLAGYNANGLETIFVIIFSELNSYEDSWNKYKSYSPEVKIPSYKLLRNNELVELSLGNLKIQEMTYKLNNKIINIYHIFVNMK